MISDDELLLYYYRDGLDPTERARVATSLAKDPELAQPRRRQTFPCRPMSSSAGKPLWQRAHVRALPFVGKR